MIRLFLGLRYTCERTNRIGFGFLALEAPAGAHEGDSDFLIEDGVGDDFSIWDYRVRVEWWFIKWCGFIFLGR